MISEIVQRETYLVHESHDVCQGHRQQGDLGSLHVFLRCVNWTRDFSRARLYANVVEGNEGSQPLRCLERPNVDGGIEIDKVPHVFEGMGK